MEDKNKIIAALDIGSSKIICVIASIDIHNHLTIIGVGHQPSAGVGNNGVISDIKALEDRIVAAVSEAENKAKVEAENVVVNISGNKLYSFSRDEEININGADVHINDVQKLVTNAFAEFTDDKKIVIQAIPLSYTLDGIDGIKNPCYMCGDKLTVHLNVVTIDIAAKKNLAHCLARCHLDIDTILPSGYAAALGCLTHDEMKMGCLVLDIGNSNISIAIFDDGNLAYAASLALGGKFLTNDIKQIFSLKTNIAEKLKTIYGSVFMDNQNKRDVIDLFDIINTEEIGDNSYILKHKLVEIISDRTEEILKLVRNFLEKDKNAKKYYQRISGNIVLTGGTANLVGIAELAQSIFDRKVRIGGVEQFDFLPDEQKDPIFTTAYGMLKFACDNHNKKALGFENCNEKLNPLLKLLKNLVFFDKISNFVKKYF
jgi:cell division protein FtsA